MTLHLGVEHHVEEREHAGRVIGGGVGGVVVAGDQLAELGPAEREV